MSHFASRIGAWLGVWNDRHLWHLDRMADAPRWRRLIDRLAGWLYTRGER